MRFDALVGGSYKGRAVAADAERSINVFTEKIEEASGRTKATRVLLSKPGLGAFANLSAYANKRITPIQHAIVSHVSTFGPSIGGDNTMTATGTFPNPTQPGNVLVIAVAAMPDSEINRVLSPHSVTDSQGNAYTEVLWCDRHVANGPSIGFFIARNTAGGANTVTFSAIAEQWDSISSRSWCQWIGMFEYQATDAISVEGSALDQNWTHPSSTLNVTDSTGATVSVAMTGATNVHSYALIDLHGGGDYLIYFGLDNAIPTTTSLVLTPGTYPALAVVGSNAAMGYTFTYWDIGAVTWSGSIDFVTALLEINGRVFATGQSGPLSYFFELFRDGTAQLYGNGLPGDARLQMCASQTEILVLAGGIGYVFNLGANTFEPITDPDFPVGAIKCDFLDGYFLVLEPNSQTFAISALNDATSWDALDFGDVEGEPGNIVSLIVDHRQVWFLGNTHGEVYTNSGDANFPITRLNGAFFEQGIAAIDSVCRCDNSIFWLGRNRDGAGVVWRANGYTPQRVSTYAIEDMIASFGDISTASAYCYQDGGHTFYRLDFAEKALLYDVGEGEWHERTFWDATTGTERADLARCHVYAWGKHLVGGPQSALVYEMSDQFTTDNGAPIRRVRSAPDLANGGKWTFYSEMRLLVQAGVGLDGDVVPGADPQIAIQISNDGGFTWGPERWRSLGRMGDYRRIVRWAQLGRSNNRAFRLICTDPVKFVLISADLDVVEGR